MARQKRQPVRPSVDELDKVLGPARDARRAREALSLPAQFTLSRPTPESLKSEQLAKKYRAEMHKFAEERMRTDLAQSKSLQAVLDRWVAARRVAIQGLSGLLPKTRFQVIDQPYRILTTGGLQLDSSGLQSLSSWAKLRLDFRDDGWASWELIFSYFWQNSTARPVIVAATVPITLNGRVAAAARTIALDPPPPGSRSLAHLTLSVGLEAFDWVTNTDVGVSSPTWVAADVRAFNTQGLGEIVSQNVFRGFSLDVQDLFVRSGEALVFDVSLKISAFIDDAGIYVDFSSNAFQVTSPWAALKITSLLPWRNPDF